jgi:myo-inositol-1(or 4)-monophosphatase
VSGRSGGFIDVAEKAALRAGKIILKGAGRIRKVEYKSEIDLVTDIDKKSQKAIVETILKSFPGHGITAEEKVSFAGKEPFRWIIDPLDGTTNFVHGYPCYCVSIGLEHAGETVAGAVYVPRLDEMFTAVRGRGAFLNGRRIRVSRVRSLRRALLATGFSYSMREEKKVLPSCLSIFRELLENSQEIRRDGAAAFDLCCVACGRFDAFFEEGLKEWDFSAGSLIVKEAGGRVTDFFGGRLTPRSKTIVAGNPAVHSIVTHVTDRFPVKS